MGKYVWDSSTALLLTDNEKNVTKAEREAPRPVQQLSVDVRGQMLFETVRRARRRILLNEVLRQGAHAFSAALLAWIVVLLAGTELLSWLWLMALPLATLAVGAYLIWRGRPSAYQAAQRVDRALELCDALSTALFFAITRRPSTSVEVCRAQRSQAERIAAACDIRRAIPLRMPKAIYATALLGLIASSLLALRYGLERRLDLHAPLARIVQEKFGINQPPPAVEAHRGAPAQKPEAGQNPLRSPEDSSQNIPGELDAAGDAALDTVGEPDVDNSKNGAQRAAQSEHGSDGKSQSSEGLDTGEGNSGSQQSAEARQSAPGKQPSSTGASDNPGLLGKFRDAMSGLLSRMRQPSAAQGAQQQQASAQNGRQGGNQDGRQEGQQNGQQGNGQPSDSQDGQPGEEGQNSQSAQAQRSGQSGEQPSTHQPGSGIGRQDGNKDVKLAEQLAAMGKISEIIGKRSANVTGDLTIEVQNSNPQLTTPYAQRPAHHTEAGGEISRDEVPVALQAYVQEYFEQLRKLAPDAPHPDARTRRHGDAPKAPSF